ncbi:MAG: DNA alkylation repair protein [Gemmatimonadetes bacterium]|uniref:DNA alkylation repair protein n=1 Tax=Candidatus Kutchimonas denitrificans TaxID=3056748 RepID=A0AAE4Z7N1_9BACT|nr:DNA alkylation repair protein [Gemmatimonadota bacterium]NIR73972.1 DNA alkylation repair protein [Candidatus Kutchimonas denitrificans]NIS02961.1 DNA alkylation repair protein [Gemmatimonadota bacterium]NIT68678.1 DNA alkylation repair protein [Gemmatimonadota bacterium]NIU53259.1 hypothetical protein [Gemmatimonadota bacterium]
MSNGIEHSVAYLRRRLRELATAESREAQQRFFKGPVHSLGVRTPDVRKLAGAAAREYRERQLSLGAIIDLASRLWHDGVLEERVLAVVIVSRFASQLEHRHWKRFDAWASSLSNWGETDALSAEILSPLLAHEPSLVKNLKNWTRSDSRWRRRAAAVSLAKAARRGDRHDAAFEICDRLAEDRDDMVEKAVGWLLKEISRTDPDAVLRYLLANRDRLSRTTLRYAAEKLPDEMRDRALSA